MAHKAVRGISAKHVAEWGHGRIGPAKAHYSVNKSGGSAGERSVRTCPKMGKGGHCVESCDIELSSHAACKSNHFLVQKVFFAISPHLRCWLWLTRFTDFDPTQTTNAAIASMWLTCASHCIALHLRISYLTQKIPTGRATKHSQKYLLSTRRNNVTE